MKYRYRTFSALYLDEIAQLMNNDYKEYRILEIQTIGRSFEASRYDKVQLQEYIVLVEGKENEDQN
jgi:hypothetical protein